MGPVVAPRNNIQGNGRSSEESLMRPEHQKENKSLISAIIVSGISEVSGGKPQASSCRHCWNYNAEEFHGRIKGFPAAELGRLPGGKGKEKSCIEQWLSS